jgi:hypothetical protein
MNTATHKTETPEFVAALAAAAKVIADQLHPISPQRYAEVVFSPGDATLYRVIVARPRNVTSITEDAVTHIGGLAERNYMVTLANPDFGRTYQWVGEPLHWDYVADKWTMKYNGKADEWTGRVLCGFLNELAKLVPSVTG